MQAYMKIGKKEFDGQVTEKDHAKWIYLQSFSFGVQSEGGNDPSQQGRLVAGAVYYGELNVTKDTDTVSPVIASAVSTGLPIPSVTIHVCDDSNKVEPVLAIELTDALISNFSLSAGGGRPTESLSFRYSKIKVSTTAIDQKGTKGATASYTWDLLKKELA